MYTKYDALNHKPRNIKFATDMKFYFKHNILIWLKLWLKLKNWMKVIQIPLNLQWVLGSKHSM